MDVFNLARTDLSPPPRALPRTATAWELLAGLRFALAWIVMATHVIFYFHGVDPLTRGLSQMGGKAAVTGFLLVSGYSIASSLSARPEGFFRRRLLRIYPLYLTAILLSCGLQLALHGAVVMPSGQTITGNGPLSMVGNALLLQTYAVKPIAFDGPVWSLAVEVSYYLAAPLLLVLGRRAALLLLAASAVCYVMPRSDGLGPLYYVLTHLNGVFYAWAWLMGFLCFGRRSRAAMALFAAIGTALVALNRGFNPELLAPLTFLAAFGILLLATGRARPPRLPAALKRTLLYLGDLSYPLYLLHFPCLIAAAACGITRPLPAMACAVGASMLALEVVDVRLKRALLAGLPRVRRHLQLRRAPFPAPAE